MKHPFVFALAFSGVLWSSGCARLPAPESLEAGVVAAQEDDWERAVSLWERVLERDPGSVAAHNNLAVALEKKGDWEKARQEYEAALGLDPDNQAVRDNYESFKARWKSGRGKPF